MGRRRIYQTEAEAKAAQAAQNRAWFDKRKANGVCPGCGVKHEGKRFYCFACRVERATRDRNRKAAECLAEGARLARELHAMGDVDGWALLRNWSRRADRLAEGLGARNAADESN